MPKIQYIEKRFSKSSLTIIVAANQIIESYARQGYDLTLRQLYYQFVARNLIPNTEASYNRIGSIVNDARLAGFIDWDYIQDRTRNLKKNSHWSGPAEIVRACADQYQIDKWNPQEYRPEVWIEKDALVGVIEKVCKPLDVSYFSCRGYTSQSEMWSASQRLLQYLDNDQTPIILHLGDHDPSGKDMTRDIEDRLELFCGVGIEVRRLALNWDQIKLYNPPPNPAKLSDSRARDYVRRFGYESWELDALDPATISKLITDAVLDVRDDKLWDAAVDKETDHKERLFTISQELEEEYNGEDD